MSVKSAFEVVHLAMEKRIFPADGSEGEDPCVAACRVAEELNVRLPDDFRLAPSECLLVWELQKR